MVNKGQGEVGPGKMMEGVSIPIMAATRFNREKLTDEVSGNKQKAFTTDVNYEFELLQLNAGCHISRKLSKGMALKISKLFRLIIGI